MPVVKKPEQKDDRQKGTTKYRKSGLLSPQRRSPEQ